MLQRTLCFGRLALGVVAFLGSCGAAWHGGGPERAPQTRFNFWLEDEAASPDCQTAAIRSGLSRHPRLIEAETADKADVRIRIVSCGRRSPRTADSRPSERGSGAAYEVEYRVEALAVAGDQTRPVSVRDQTSWRGAGQRLADAVVRQLVLLPTLPQR